MQITHQSDACRFHTAVDGHEAQLTYRLDDGRMTINHTGVPAGIGGRGIAGELVREALEFARSEGLNVVPACSYAETYIQRNPQYADLVA